MTSTIRCRRCLEPIEHCKGRYGSWMHSDTRRELGPDEDHVAYPAHLGAHR